MMTLGELELALGCEDPEARRRAVESLREPTYTSDLVAEKLLIALGDADWRVRKQAVEVSRSLAPSSELLGRLLQALEPGDNVGLRNAAVEALGAFSEKALLGIIEKLPTLDADGKKLALEALALLRLPSALAVVGSLAGDADPNVRAAAVEAVATIGSSAPERAFEILSSALDREGEEAIVRLSALEASNRLGLTLPWSRIETMLEEPVLERAAWAAAGRSAHPRAWGALLWALERARGGQVPALLAALKDHARVFSHDRYLLPPPPSERLVDLLIALARSESEDLATRKAALVVGSALGIERMAPVAAEALGDPRLLAEADDALGRLGSKALPAVLDRLASADPETCAACIEIVTSLAGSRSETLTLAMIRSWVDSGIPVIVRAGLIALTRLGDDTCFDTVLPWLSSAHAGGTAESALAALAERHSAAARRRARSASAHGAEGHAAAVIYGVLPAPIRDTIDLDIAYLSLLLSDPSTAVRRAALAGLGNLGTAPCAPVLALALTDEEPLVRQAAVRALSGLQNEAGAFVGVTRLIDLIGQSNDQELVATAIAAVAEAADARLLGVLRPLVHHDEPLIAVAAVEALGRIPDARRIEALVEGLSHAEAEVVKAALVALAESIDARILAYFGACLDHPAWDVRRLAAELLARVDGEPARALLRARQPMEDNPRVLEAIHGGLSFVTRALHTPLPPRAGSLWPR